ncbi:MAG TPA: hypothetical protein VGL97_17600 [Bryobacteraceae bacterium]|jgi:hypothetical protein
MAPDKDIEKASESAVEFAFWTAPGALATVTYSLPLFHEIDFVVNEGYRKIPHGGVETGGLLFGSVDEKGPRIEAFRNIECEHASGPSFLLSEGDLERLAAQLAAAPADPELQGLKAIGWFLAHTRSPLLLTDRELAVFGRFFPEENRVTVLVKPERFQPTRFGFLVRASDGSVARDAAEHSVILPLPGRSKRSSGEPVSSIPAPTASAAALRRLKETEDRPAEGTAELPKEAPPGPQPVPKSPDKAASKRLTLEKMRWTEEEDRPAVMPPDRPQAGPGMNAGPARKPDPSAAQPAATSREADVPDPYEQLARLTKKKPRSRFRLAMVLPLAGLLGCAVGYWAYLRLPAAIIPLHVRALSQTVLVSWPPDATRNAVYAALRVDDGTPVLLSSAERTAGQVEVKAGVDVKVELIARNWMRDSRGIVRYVKAENLRPRPAIP